MYYMTIYNATSCNQMYFTYQFVNFQVMSVPCSVQSKKVSFEQTIVHVRNALMDTTQPMHLHVSIKRKLVHFPDVN